jgi:PIN domain nuclease of toxin-antitoxin system
MRLLLDTHIFMWLRSEEDKVSENALAACRNRNNDLLLSLASVWEMQIKINTGKLQLNNSLANILQAEQKNNGIQLLPITLSHILDLAYLPDHHRDPFDRMLVAQCLVEDLTLVTADPILHQYPVPILW